MGMHNPMPLGPAGVLSVSSSSDTSEGWNDGVCPVHVLAMSLSLAIKVGWVYSTSLTIAGSLMRESSSLQLWTAAAAQN